jgi:hypothetical protein
LDLKKNKKKFFNQYSKTTVIAFSFSNHFPITFQSLFYSLSIKCVRKVYKHIQQLFLTGK